MYLAVGVYVHVCTCLSVLVSTVYTYIRTYIDANYVLEWRQH